ncbi:MAG: DUF2860 family protein [Desulfopila sp.]|jgi:hypothetical protein|nr:DUF2860 family protein [Desulfopila sp.]
MKSFIYALFTVALFTAAVCSAAEESDFTGDIGVGVMFIDSANNLNPGSSKKIISNLDNGADRELTTVPIILPALAYYPDKNKPFHYTLTSRPPIEESGAFALSVGAATVFDQIADIKVALFAAPFGEVWKNPYLTNAPRDETDSRKYGTYLALDNILATRFRGSLIYYHTDVDDDLIGEITPELERDGNVVTANLGYAFDILPTFSLIPALSYSLGDHEGEAYSYSSYGVKLGGRYFSGKIALFPEISYKYTEYDAIHPIFQETRDENKVSFNVLLQYAAPFDMENFVFSAIAGYSLGDSGIDFYDTESIRFGLSLVYRF